MKPLAITLAMMGWCSVAIAQDDPASTLFTNVHVFDGVSSERIENANVLVEGNLIKSVSTDPIAAYASPADPLLGNQFTFDEIKAAVDTAGDWGTYVTVHAYHPSSINRAIDAGIKDVGHGQLLDDATLQRMSDEGVFLSTQPFTVCSEPQLDDFSNSKLALVCQGTERVYKVIKSFPELKVTYGTDLFFLPEEELAKQTQQMERLLPWFDNPYQKGSLGTVSEGGYADLLLVDGNPLEDLKAVGRPLYATIAD